MGSSSPANPAPLMELRPSNGIGREVRDIGGRDRDRDRDRDNARVNKEREREREHDRERENKSHYPGFPPGLERVAAPRDLERDFERERPNVHHAQTLPPTLRRSPLAAQLPPPSKSNSRPSSPKLYYPYTNGTSHIHDASRRHTLNFPPSNSSSTPSLGRPHHTPVHSHPERPPPSSHPTSYSRHQHPHQRHQSRDEDVMMVSPVSPVPPSSGGLPFVTSRSAHPPLQISHSNPPIMRRISNVGSSGSTTLHGSSTGSLPGAGATATSPIIVSPAESVEDAQQSSIVGRRERERESHSRRNSASNSSGAPVARSRSHSGSGSRPSSVVLAPHLVRTGPSQTSPVVRKSDSPRMHSAAHPPPPHHTYSYPTQSQRQPSPGTSYSSAYPAPAPAPAPPAVVYVYGYPPQTQPPPIVHPPQPQPPTMTSGSHSAPSHSHHPPPAHSPLTTRPPASNPPPQAGHHHSQSQTQPAQRRQTYPQQNGNQPQPQPQPSHSHSHSHPQPHHRHPPAPPPPPHSSHHHPHHSQSQPQQPYHHSGKPVLRSPNSKNTVVSSSASASASSHSQHPSHPPPTSSFSTSSSATTSIQQILNTAYLDLLGVVDKEISTSVQTSEKDRARREKFERALEDRDRLLRQKDEEILTLRCGHVAGAPEKENAMSKLQSEITHLKGELMGMRDDKEEMMEEIDQLQDKLTSAESACESRGAEIVMLKEQVGRWRDEAQVWREEKVQLVGSLDGKEKEVRALLEKCRQLEEGSASAEQTSMITTSPTEAITASPLPYTAPLPSSSSPRPSPRQSHLDVSPRHAYSVPAPPIMGSLPSGSPRNQVTSISGGIGRPGSRSGAGEERRQQPQPQPHHSHPPPQRPHISLPIPLAEERPSSARPSTAMSPHQSMSLPLPTPSRPSSAHLSPSQQSLPLPSRPPSRPLMNGKRSREDANDRRESDGERPETPKRPDTAQGKASKVLKRSSGDDASTSSSSAHSEYPTTKNPYLSHVKTRPKTGSIEDGVFRHVQHPHSKSMPIPQLQYHHQYQQPQQTSSFWKSVSTSGSTAAAVPAKKDEEPKLSLKHFTLLYEEVGKDYVCRECKPSATTKRKTFPKDTPFPKLMDHSLEEHGERCKAILKYSPSKLAEEKVLLEGGGGVLLSKAGSKKEKEKSNSK